MAKQDLQSFLEVAEDLNTRGLSERNLDSWSSREKYIHNFLNKMLNHLPKEIEIKSIIDEV